jgi:hypothetical protein
MRRKGFRRTTIKPAIWYANMRFQALRLALAKVSVSEITGRGEGQMV